MPRLLLLSNARSGSTLLSDLLNSHPEIYLESELLNDENDIGESSLEYLEKKLSLHSQTFVGFKVFPEQIFQRGLDLNSIVKHLGITHIIVLWREGILETLVSRRIADKTGIWYTANSDNSKFETLKSINIELEDLIEYTNETTRDWNTIVDQWPLGISPIFIKYEDLASKRIDHQLHLILSKLSCPVDNFVPRPSSKRQNPRKLEDKVENFNELPLTLINGKLNVKEIFSGKQIQESIIASLPQEVLPFAPNREPTVPLGGWRYRVAEPFITDQVKQNVLDAIESGSISSAGHWPRVMSSKLKELFQLPVSQPCCNGFTALTLAMQCADLGEGDEIIMPSMTMVAVPNAAYFVRAQPIFADCEKDNYNPSWNEILAVSGEKTKAVVVTHTYGVPTLEMEKIAKECQNRGWWLIEDISEAVGVSTTIADGSRKLLGTFGHFACASLYVNKMIHAGDGGFVIAKDPKFGPRLTSLVNHGFTPSYHFVHFEPALNAKINGIGAAIACGCVDEIQHIMEHRSQVAKEYRKSLKLLPVTLMPKCGPLDTPWVFSMVCKSKQERTELRAYLAEKGIETRDFFFALHLQPAYYKREAQRLPISEVLGSTGFYLPTHSNLKIQDIHYITSCIQLFFKERDPASLAIDFSEDELSVIPRKQAKQSLQIKPGTFQVQVRTFNDSGSLKQTQTRSHLYYSAVAVGFEAENAIIQEKWDSKYEIISEIKNCLTSSRDLDMSANMKKHFQPYLEYFESQMNFEQEACKPWLLEDITLTSKEYPEDAAQQLKRIPTTSDEETLQLLLHILRYTRPETIWEIGCWMGHSTYMMAALCKALSLRSKIFACDAFKWQKWMESYTPDINLMPGQSFLENFNTFLEPYASSIQPVNWPYDITTLPEILQNQRPDLIYLDITQEDEDLEVIWGMIKKSLIPDKTIILFNGLSYKSIPFFTRHAKEFEAIAKPYTMAKAFVYRSQAKSNLVHEMPPLCRKLNFQSDPAWTHHHQNLFCSSVALLRNKFHDPSSPILFFPAIEEKMCDEPELFTNNEWTGIIHSVPFYPQQFYTPDLNRLCSSRYSPMMRNCKGLFTLTQLQANFLKKNLPKEYNFPIQPLKYPVREMDNFEESLVPKMLSQRGENVYLTFIGSFARDFQLFYDCKVPQNFEKVLITGDEESLQAAEKAPASVKFVPRLDSEEYEEFLKKSVVFLALVYDGAANTIILECIARNIPIVSPKLSSCVEYLGQDYPLLYDTKDSNFEELLTLENIQASIAYLKSMDKTHLTPEKMIESFTNGAVLQCLPSSVPTTSTPWTTKSISNFPKYKVTICICSYKRTHHLPQILQALWENQDFKGEFQIIVWNNNDARANVVRKICSKYIQQSNDKKSLELISSTSNHFCSIRFSMPSLMKSESLLICDDDIIPGPNFISFFLNAHNKHSKDVLCVRGHVFLPHELDLDNVKNAWENYEGLRFKNDDSPEQLIHFVHADACLIPKAALREISSQEMPDPTFNLVDDYWMSFVLSHKFNRKLRKLSTFGLKHNPIQRTDDSDQIGLALHTRPEVRDARLRLYVHHMLQSWPVWEKDEPPILNSEERLRLKEMKKKFWESYTLGYNISSKIDVEGVLKLKQFGVKSVRIGAVGVKMDVGFDLCGFLNDPDDQIKKLKETVELLGENGITSVLTLERRLVSAETWQLIASTFCQSSFVVGYDLINEPFIELENDLHWAQIESGTDINDGADIWDKYIDIITSIRTVDQVTPIILEPTFWGRCYAIEKIPISKLKEIDSNLIISFHFYEPMLLTQRRRNKQRFQYPGEVPYYDGIPFSEQSLVDDSYIMDKFQEVKKWGDENKVKVFLGEFGICRDIKGAEGYLSAGLKACKQLGICGYLYSFRDHEWEAMNYEFGSDLSVCSVDQDNSMLFNAILQHF